MSSWRVHGEIELTDVRPDRAVAVVAQLSGMMREHRWGTVQTDGSVIVFAFHAPGAKTQEDAKRSAVSTIDTALEDLGIGSSERRWKDLQLLSD
jgi:hypothetical protein